MSEWKSIESAPKDGKFLVFAAREPVGRWMMVADGHMLALSQLRDTPHHLSGHHWTHWMPLPDPPPVSPERRQQP